VIHDRLQADNPACQFDDAFVVDFPVQRSINGDDAIFDVKTEPFYFHTVQFGFEQVGYVGSDPFVGKCVSVQLVPVCTYAMYHSIQ